MDFSLDESRVATPPPTLNRHVFFVWGFHVRHATWIISWFVIYMVITCIEKCGETQACVYII